MNTSHRPEGIVATTEQRLPIHRSSTAEPGSPSGDRAFCREMLPKVSRTFAVCIRLLPPQLEHPVLIAYLLCRVADTLEDTIRLTPPRKPELLHHLGACLEGASIDVDPLLDAFPEPATDEEALVTRADAVLREFFRLTDAQQVAIRPAVQEMCIGMAEFAARPRSSVREQLVLDTIEELERYCYYVAGTVGHLLTELFRLHTSSVTAKRYARLKELATSFGLGLQLTNIIKDVADDRRRGWSFVPRQLCQLAGVRPEDLVDGHHREEAGRVMDALIAKTKGHLCDALEYSVRLPHRAYRIRLFCLTSLYFAVRTIRLAEGDRRLLDPNHKVKISRGEVFRTLRATRLVAPSNRLVRAYFQRLAGPGWACGSHGVP